MAEEEGVFSFKLTHRIDRPSCWWTSWSTWTGGAKHEAAKMVSDETLRTLAEVLQNEDSRLPKRFRALFALRGAKGKGATVAREAIVASLGAKSALLRHELAFCLGQMQDEEAVDTLEKLLANTAENSMVRHEAGEALGAIGCSRSITALETGSKDELPEIRETCELALYRIHALSEASQASGYTPYKSVDPTPPLPLGTPTDELKDILLSEKAPMHQRYGAMFALRNSGTEEGALALANALRYGKSALLKHELAYVLGQLQRPSTVPALEAALRDVKEHPMVRHEAAEALGSIATAEARALLEEFVRDPEPVVAESCEVALDILEFETSGEFQYCTVDA